MGHITMQYELAFYTRELNIIGQYYYRPENISAAYPDLLFFCLYTAKLLVNRKMKMFEAREIKNKLALGEEWESVMTKAEGRPFSLPYRHAEFRGLEKSSFSSCLIIGKKVHFRLGFCGFGFFSNKKEFGRCAAASVYALLESVYRQHCEDRRYVEMLWQAAAALGRLEFGRDLHNKNCLEVAQSIYVEITQDFFPGITLRTPQIS